MDRQIRLFVEARVHDKDSSGTIDMQTPYTLPDVKGYVIGFENLIFIGHTTPYDREANKLYPECTAQFDYTRGEWIIYSIKP